MSINQPAILGKWFELNIKGLRDFFSFMEASIKEAEDKYIEKYQDSIKDLSEEEIEEFTEIYGDEFHGYNKYKQRLYSSFLIIIFSFLETSLNTICRNIKKIKDKAGVKIKLSDIKGKDIERAKIYLNKICGCSDSFFGTRIWQEIKMLQAVRNAFVHNEGKIPKEKKGDALKKYIADNPDYFSHKNIELDHNVYPVYILVKEKYCLSSLNNIEIFLGQLLKDISWK